MTLREQIENILVGEIPDYDDKWAANTTDQLEALLLQVREDIKREIGLNFLEWFYESTNELIEDAIKRITGVSLPKDRKHKHRKFK